MDKNKQTDKQTSGKEVKWQHKYFELKNSWVTCAPKLEILEVQWLAMQKL